MSGSRRGRVVVVTGTDTGVGKTVATAAYVAAARARGEDVVMVKPAQTGTADGDADAAEVRRLSGCAVHTYVELEEPLAPETAALRAGVRLPTVAEHARRILALARSHDLVVVEGAGGLLVRLDTEGGTIADIALATGAEVLVVCRAGLGTLNHTGLTVEALRARGIEPAGLVVGSRPAEPGLAETCNLADLPRTTGTPIAAVIPENAGRLEPAAFTAAATGWFRSPS